MEVKTEIKRLSMHSALCNARIFDDDAWEEDPETKKQQHKTDTNVTMEEGEISDTDKEISVKKETLTPPNVKNEQDIKFDLKNVKTEPLDFNFNDSPLTKQLFSKIKLEDTPIKTEKTEEEEIVVKKERETRKSARRTVFTRNSPYKREEPMGLEERRVSVKLRLGLRENDSEPNKTSSNKREYEADPQVLERRQKQIDYGKNTIGYDNYTRSVPKRDRSERDPKTPDKFKKYSRRGWDGLIKQWRLKLHKYDEA